MRTTVDIPDSAYRQLKAKAALEGCSVKALVIRMVETELLGPARRKKRRIRLPLIESDRPATLHLTNDQVNEILYP